MCGTGCGSAETYAEQVCMPLNGKVRCIDRCIHQIIAALNAGGVPTIACCCGHGDRLGDIVLEDGRVIGVFDSEDQFEAADECVKVAICEDWLAGCSRKEIRVKIMPHLSCTGEERWKKAWIDQCRKEIRDGHARDEEGA